MFVGKQLGPFAIDKELGSGAMGAVYRGIYAKTGQRVAVKVMAPGLASSDSASARFEREAAILKQFNHRNIVRLFGTGKYHGTRYYAMEYVDGEPIDRVLARRGRLTWEEVVDFGMQLCAALQHAHDAGIIHRDLKPSNLMILRDGKTLKLTDFGIAKDMDVTGITSANCAVGTAAYMSPEQCRGERDITAKSDLYSLGVVFYELLTGRKPFNAENAMDMFLQHVNGTFERPSRLIFDIPSWLDTLVCQLLEKKAEHRPLNAGMVYSALEGIREKVEAQESAGVDAVKRKLLDTPRNQRNVNEEDKEAARTLLGGKGRLRRKRKRAPWYRGTGMKAAGLVAALAGVGVLIWLAVKPPAPEKLFAQAQQVMKKNDPDQWDKATEPIDVYLQHYGGRESDETKQINEWKRKIDLDKNDALVEHYIRTHRSSYQAGLQVQPQNEADALAFKAAMAADEGDLKKAGELWNDVKTKFGEGSGHSNWGQLAEKRLEIIRRVLEQEKSWELAEIKEGNELEQRAFEAYRAQVGNKVSQAREGFESLKQQCDATFREKSHPAWDDEDRYWYLYAAMKLNQLKKQSASPSKAPP